MSPRGTMPDPGGDTSVPATTAPIFDDRAYRSEALNLPVNENEEELEIKLALEAREAGIEAPDRYLNPEVHDASTAMSTMTMSSEHRSSTSTHSRETESTGYTSHPSVDRSPMQRTPVPSEAAPQRLRPSVFHRISSSAVSATNSMASNASSQPRSNPRKHKRTSIFSIFRRDSSGPFASRSPSVNYFTPDTQKLACGHTLSFFALKAHINQARENKEQMESNCCGIPIPREFLETVMSKEEAALVTRSAPFSPDLSSLRDSAYSEDGMSSFELSRPSLSQYQFSGTFLDEPDTPTSRDMSETECAFLNPGLANEAFKSLQAQEKELFGRIALFESKQRKALVTLHQQDLIELEIKFEADKMEMSKQHVQQMESLDESQIIAEHDLRKAHDQERQNVATALKHMKAYCSGSATTHTVTDEDLKKLERQQITQQKLPQKHGSAINVLRAKQEQDTKVKLRRQDAELQQLVADFEKAKSAAEEQYAKDVHYLDTLMETRRRRVMRRWDLKFEIWRRDWQNQHKTTLSGRLPHVNWPEKPINAAPINEVNLLSFYNENED